LNPLCHPGRESARDAESQAASFRENQPPVEPEVRPRSKQGQYLTRQAKEVITNKGLGIFFSSSTGEANFQVPIPILARMLSTKQAGSRISARATADKFAISF
jgi:hypothetical protein